MMMKKWTMGFKNETNSSKGHSVETSNVGILCTKQQHEGSWGWIIFSPVQILFCVATAPEGMALTTQTSVLLKCSLVKIVKCEMS
jgi:hypothetical protein